MATITRWSITFDGAPPTEDDLERIARSIRDGYRSGVITTQGGDDD